MLPSDTNSNTQAVLFPRPARKLPGNLNFIFNVVLKAGSVMHWLIWSTHGHIKKGSGFAFESPGRVCVFSTCQCGLSPCTQFYKVKMCSCVVKCVWMCSPMCWFNKARSEFKRAETWSLRVLQHHLLEGDGAALAILCTLNMFKQAQQMYPDWKRFQKYVSTLSVLKRHLFLCCYSLLTLLTTNTSPRRILLLAQDAEQVFTPRWVQPAAGVSCAAGLSQPITD